MQVIAQNKKRDKEVPEYLIYEIIDGKPIYYAGYKLVLDKKLNPEDIMGSSALQSLLIEIIKDYLKSKLGKAFYFFSSELGIHITKNNNLAADIAIIPKDKLPISKIRNKYLNIPPSTIIEVDTKVENPDYSDYYNIKTQKLLDFGVEKVVWIYTRSQKVTVAVKNRPWFTIDWTEEIEVMGHQFSIEQLLAAEGIDIHNLKIIEEEEE